MGEVPDTPANRGAKGVALSLLLYPGGGQWYFDQRGRGAAIGTVFTIAFFMFLYHVLSNIKTFYEVLTKAGDIANLSPAVPHILGWLVASGVLWLGAGIDAFFVGRAYEPPPVSDAETPESPAESPEPEPDETS